MQCSHPMELCHFCTEILESVFIFSLTKLNIEQYEHLVSYCLMMSVSHLHQWNRLVDE